MTAMQTSRTYVSGTLDRPGGTRQWSACERSIVDAMWRGAPPRAARLPLGEPARVLVDGRLVHRVAADVEPVDSCPREGLTGAGRVCAPLDEHRLTGRCPRRRFETQVGQHR